MRGMMKVIPFFITVIVSAASHISTNFRFPLAICLFLYYLHPRL